MEFLAPDDFATEAHRVIYEAALALADRREGIDLVMVQSELEKTGRLERAGGPAYLASLVDVVPDVENVEGYARLVREASLRRLVILQSRRAIREAVSAPDAETVLENAQRELVEIAKGSIKGGFVKLSRIAEKNEEEIQNLHGRGGNAHGPAVRVHAPERAHAGPPEDGPHRRRGPARHGQDGLRAEHRVDAHDPREVRRRLLLARDVGRSSSVSASSAPRRA